MDKETQGTLDSIPQKVKDDFIPRLKEQFQKMNAFGQCFEKAVADGKDPEQLPDVVRQRDELLNAMETLVKDFNKAGGSVKQWNVLAPLVHYGHFGL